VRAQNLSLFVVDEGENLRKELLAFVAEEFVVGHTRLPQFLKGTARILDPADGRFKHGFGHDFCMVESRVLHEEWVTISAWFGSPKAQETVARGSEWPQFESRFGFPQNSRIAMRSLAIER